MLLIDNLAGFVASRVNGQPKCLRLFVSNLDRQITVRTAFGAPGDSTTVSIRMPKRRWSGYV